MRESELVAIKFPEPVILNDVKNPAVNELNATPDRDWIPCCAQDDKVQCP